MAAGLDWRGHSVGPPLPCRLCRRPALLRDEHGRPCHKVCAEQATAPAAADSGALVVDLDAYRTTRAPDAARPRRHLA